jgi:hypothetical protein
MQSSYHNVSWCGISKSSLLISLAIVHNNGETLGLLSKAGWQGSQDDSADPLQACQYGVDHSHTFIQEPNLSHDPILIYTIYTNVVHASRYMRERRQEKTCFGLSFYLCSLVGRFPHSDSRSASKTLAVAALATRIPRKYRTVIIRTAL